MFAHLSYLAPADVVEKPQLGDVSLDLLKKILVDADPSDHEIKPIVLAAMQERPDLFRFDTHDLSMDAKRVLTLDQLKHLSSRNILTVEDVFERPMRYFAGAEIFNMFAPTMAIKIGVHYTLFGGAVASLGTKKHRQFIDMANSLESLCSFSLTEMGHGSNARAVETIATFDKEKDEFVIHSPTTMAQKYFIGGSVHGTHTVVFAQMMIDGVDHGVQAFVVQLRPKISSSNTSSNASSSTSAHTTHAGHAGHGSSASPSNGASGHVNPPSAHPGYGEVYPTIRIKDCGHKQGLQGVDNGRIMFEHHRVPRDHLLDRFGYVTREGKYETDIKSNAARFATMIGALIYGRVGLSLASVALSKLGLTIAIRYASERLQFGPPGKPEIPILDFLSHQRRLLIPLAKTYAYHFAGRRLLQQVQANDQKKLHILAAGMKAMATWHVNDVMAVARQCCGGQGYLSENRLGEMKADVEIYTTFEGDNVVLLQQVAASLLKEFRENFKQLSSTFNFLAETVTTQLTEKNPARKRYTTKDHLLSTSFHMDALRFRKKRSVQILAAHLRAASKQKSFFEAWNDSLDLALQAAIAHVDYVVFKSFDQNLNDTLKSCQDEAGVAETKQLFKRVKNMYALSTMQQHAAFFLQEHYFAPSKAKAIAKQVNDLCAVLRPHATTLVSAFDIPEFFLPPLGKSTWVAHNKL